MWEDKLGRVGRYLGVFSGGPLSKQGDEHISRKEYAGRMNVEQDDEQFKYALQWMEDFDDWHAMQQIKEFDDMLSGMNGIKDPRVDRDGQAYTMEA